MKYLPYLLLPVFLLPGKGSRLLCQTPVETPVEEPAYLIEEEAEGNDYNFTEELFTDIFPDTPPRERYLESDLKNRPFDRSRWNGLVKDLDYSTKTKKVKKKAPPPAEPPGDESPTPERSLGFFEAKWFKMLANIILIVGGGVLLAFILYKLLGFNSGPANKQIARTGSFEKIDLEKIEENLHETDLDRYIRLALDRDDLLLVVRLYYLAVIQALAQRNVIKWKKDKTNRHYLNEMASSGLYAEFRELTRLYEQTWYGNRKPDKQGLEQLTPRFKAFIKSVHQSNDVVVSS